MPPNSTTSAPWAIKLRPVENMTSSFSEQLMEHVIQPALEMGLLQRQVRPEIMVEWVYRVLLSLLTLPSNWIKSDKELRATLHALLVPVLLR